MKHLIVTAVVFLVMAGSVHAASWTSWEDYQEYKDIKTKASEASDSGDTLNAVLNYKKAADLALKSATPEIQAWQLNNAAYSLIQRFKVLTGYQPKLDALAEMEPSKEKIAYQKEIAELFKEHIGLLEEARELLEKAGGLELTEGQGPEPKIKSNTDYVKWVVDFTYDQLGEKRQEKEQEKEQTETE
ncbi:MAG: hypothetical protein ACLFP1_08185 [Candidatus Goldiibacteriota bacterium]